MVRSLQEKEKKRHHWVYYGDGSDSIIERIAYNDIIIRKLIKKHVTRIKKEIKLIKKEYAPKIKSAKKSKKSFGNRELERMTSSRSSKIIIRPDELMEERDQKIHNLEQEINEIVSMDCKQYVVVLVGFGFGKMTYGLARIRFRVFIYRIPNLFPTLILFMFLCYNLFILKHV